MRESYGPIQPYIDEVKFYQSILQRSFDECGNDMLRAKTEQELLIAWNKREEVKKIAERVGHTLQGVR